jgi:hypothetical protein
MGRMHGLRSDMLKYIAKSTSYVPSSEYELGQHWDGIGSSGQQELKNDTFMFVSIDATLRSVLRWKKTWDEMYNVDDFDEVEISN